MKYIILLFIVSGNFLMQAQEAKYQTYSANLLIITTKGGENYQWENKDILTTLNYKTGDFKVVVNSIDFYNKESNNQVQNQNNEENTKYTFKGILPIDQIIDQKMSSQEYTIELQLVNDNIDFSNEVNFKMNIMRTSQQSDSYRVFTLIGKLYNDELELPAFKGYDNEVEIRIMFNAFWNG